jgi:Aconitase A
LPDNIVEAIEKENIYAVSVLSGNRNFEGRISPHIKANYLASPPLVVAYALAGHMEVELYKNPWGKDKNGKEIFLKEIWLSNKEKEETLREALKGKRFVERYSKVSEGLAQGQKIKTEKSSIYKGDEGSTYVKRTLFFDNMLEEREGFKKIKEAR